MLTEEFMKKNIVIGVLIGLILIISGYLCYDKFWGQNEDNCESSDLSSLTAAELDTLGNNLFEKTNIQYWTGSEYFLYSTDKLTYNDLDDDIKSIIAFSLIPVNDFSFYYSNFADILAETPNALYSSVSYDSYVRAFKSIFGNDKDVIYIDGSGWQYPLVHECFLEDGFINCYSSNGGDSAYSAAFINYNRTEISGEDIIVYVDFLNVDWSEGVFSDLDFNNFIANEDNLYELSSDELFQRYGDDAGLFKVVFKKDNINNYYWYSSELIEK